MNTIRTLRKTGKSLTEIAKEIGTSPSYLSQMLHGRKPWPPQYCVALERLTAGALSRKELRPLDYWRIWPDLEAPEAEAQLP